METAKEWQPTEKGTPQGAVISPLLANLYLNPLDHLMVGSGKEMVRYADDFVSPRPKRCWSNCANGPGSRTGAAASSALCTRIKVPTGFSEVGQRCPHRWPRGEEHGQPGGEDGGVGATVGRTAGGGTSPSVANVFAEKTNGSRRSSGPRWMTPADGALRTRASPHLESRMREQRARVVLSSPYH